MAKNAKSTDLGQQNLPAAKAKVAKDGRKGVAAPKPRKSPGGYVGSLGGKPKVPRGSSRWSADLPLTRRSK